MVSQSSRSPPPQAAYVRCTIIRFCVTVPVLSTHSTLTAPSVSTPGRLRTSDRFRASRHAPMDRNTVRITGNSSGIIAMARVIPASTLSVSRSAGLAPAMLNQVTRPTSTKSTPAITAQVFTSLPVCRCRGDASFGAAAIPSPIFPYSVCAPICSTRTAAEPWVTSVPA